MTTLAEQRQAIRHLLNENSPADAMASYFALYHPEAKTKLVLYPPEGGRATGYVARSRTGIDLFRPLVTLRLPPEDLEGSAALLYQALTPGDSVILSGPVAYEPLLRAIFDITREERLQVYALDPGRFEPMINVLVKQVASVNELPRFIIETRTEAAVSEVVASAGLNWQSPRFAEIAVNTRPSYRRRGWGRSVVAALVQKVLAGGRIPIYVAAEGNEASIRLAEGVGFVDTGAREWMIEGSLLPGRLLPGSLLPGRLTR
jgi:RimJ/RimL family protein N-acetyltransferase